VQLSQHIIFSWHSRVFRNFSCFCTTFLCFFDNLSSFDLKFSEHFCTSMIFMFVNKRRIFIALLTWSLYHSGSPESFVGCEIYCQRQEHVSGAWAARYPLTANAYFYNPRSHVRSATSRSTPAPVPPYFARSLTAITSRSLIFGPLSSDFRSTQLFERGQVGSVSTVPLQESRLWV